MGPDSEPRRPDKIILIVDDDEALLELVRRMVERAGYGALTARTAEEALKVFANPMSRIDLVIADLVMAGRGGESLVLELLRSNPGTRILLSTGLRDERVSDLLEAGVRGVVFKPYQSAALLEKVRVALDESQG